MIVLDCDASYIGKTTRQALRRFQEHGANLVKPKTTKRKQSDIYHNSSNLRRSKRNKEKLTQYASQTIKDDLIDEDLIEKQNSLIKSTLKQHEINNNHRINWIDWNIISSDNKHYRLLVRESLAITHYQLKLNKTVSSVPLIIYPEGLQTGKPKVKIKVDV